MLYFQRTKLYWKANMNNIIYDNSIKSKPRGCKRPRTARHDLIFRDLVDSVQHRLKTEEMNPWPSKLSERRSRRWDLDRERTQDDERDKVQKRGDRDRAGANEQQSTRWPCAASPPAVFAERAGWEHGTTLAGVRGRWRAPQGQGRSS